MSMSISMRDARDRFGAMVRHVNEENEEVIVTSYNKPRAVVMSFAAYEDMRLKLAHIRRVEALDERKAAQQSQRASTISPKVLDLVPIGTEFADDPDAA